MYCTKFARQENSKVQSSLYSTQTQGSTFLLVVQTTTIVTDTPGIHAEHPSEHRPSLGWQAKLLPLLNPVGGRHQHPGARFSPLAVGVSQAGWRVTTENPGTRNMEEVHLNTWRKCI